MTLLLVGIFIVVPIAEIYVIVKVGEAIGVLPTIALLILDSFLGAALLRSQGRLAWGRFNEALAQGRIPAREVFDGAMVILGGAFLITPGFISDVVGLLLLIPPSRTIFRGIVAWMARRHAAFTVMRTVRWGANRANGRDPGRAASSYDYEGTAHEVHEAEHDLPRPSGDGER